MNTRNTIVLGGILTFLIFVGARARAIPDFDTDDDLDAWHKFGLRSFHGPWSIITRKRNGDFVSYADYGARVPSDFRPISAEAIDDNDDDSSRGISRADRTERQNPSKYTTGLSDFVTGYELTPYELAVFSNSVKTSDSAINGSPLDRSDKEDNALNSNSNTDSQRLTEAIDGIEPTNKESKRDTLQLIGIVGVISAEEDSIEELTNFANTKIETSTKDGDKNTNIAEQPLIVSR